MLSRGWIASRMVGSGRNGISSLVYDGKRGGRGVFQRVTNEIRTFTSKKEELNVSDTITKYRNDMNTLSSKEIQELPIERLEELIVSTSGKQRTPKRGGQQRRRMYARHRAKLKEHKVRKKQVAAANRRKNEQRMLKIKQTQRWTEFLIESGNARPTKTRSKRA